jgi:hypothetical protein
VDARLPRWQLAVLVALLLLAHGYVVDTTLHFFNPNQISRVHLSLALAFDHKLAIDRFLVMLGTEDFSRFGGHSFTDKAPGVSFWLSPFAWLLFRSESHASIGIQGYRAIIYALRLVGISLPTVLAWLAGLRVYRAWTGSASRAAFVVLAGALGTNALVYATHIFGVVPCGICLFASFALTRRARLETERSKGLWRAALAGTLASLAFVFDPLGLFAIAVLGLHVVIGARGRVLRGALFALGALGPLGLWMAYNRACFGGVLETGINHLADAGWAAEYAKGWHGFNPPTSEALFGMWLSAKRGMLFLSPFLVLAIPGWVRLVRQRETRADALASVGVVAAVTLFASMTIDWLGGWAVGERYLVPAVPFLLVGVAAALRPPSPGRRDAFSGLALGLAVVSVVMVEASEVTFAQFPQPFDNPLRSFVWPLFRSGCVTSAYFLDHGRLLAYATFGVVTAVSVVMLGVLLRKRLVRQVPTFSFALLVASLALLPMARMGEPADKAKDQSEQASRVRWLMDCPPADGPY